MGETRFNAALRVLAAGLAASVAVLGAAACGGGERQDAAEPEGEYRVSVVEADFPLRQRLAEQVELVIGVENTGQETVPDLVITVSTSREGREDEVASGSFHVREDQPGLADDNRPVWVLDQGFPRLDGSTEPAGAETAKTNSFAFGELEPGETRTIVWRLTPARGGTYTVRYRIAAGTEGRARAVDEDGQVPSGVFQPTISTEAPETRVDDDDEVVEVEPEDDRPTR